MSCTLTVLWAGGGSAGTAGPHSPSLKWTPPWTPSCPVSQSLGTWLVSALSSSQVVMSCFVMVAQAQMGAKHGTRVGGL